MQYWPHSIDPLKPERARFGGAKPTFYSDQGDVCRLSFSRPRAHAFEQTAFEKSLFRTGGGGAVEFGAKQCMYASHGTCPL